MVIVCHRHDARKAVAIVVELGNPVDPGRNEPSRLRRNSARQRARSSCRLKGLSIRSSAPRSRQRTRVSTSCRAVSTSTGRSASSARTSLSACSPSLTGRFKSRMVKSGRSCRNASTACSPSPATRTRCPSASRPRVKKSPSALSSSAISILMATFLSGNIPDLRCLPASNRPTRGCSFKRGLMKDPPSQSLGGGGNSRVKRKEFWGRFLKRARAGIQS